MTERDIFLGALELDDPAARAAYLDDACAGRPDLRKRVEELLRYHHEHPAFLTVPVMEQLAAAGPARGVSFAPAPPLLVSCAGDGTVRLWDLSASEPRTIAPGRFPGGIRAVAFIPDGRYLVTANGNGTVYALRVGAVP